MKARILVLAVNDGSNARRADAYAIADEFTMDDSPLWLAEQVVKAQGEYGGGDLLAHGFIDVEIPDDVIAQVLRRHADAGVVAAEAVSEVQS
jgi:hypothetical protein